ASACVVLAILSVAACKSGKPIAILQPKEIPARSPEKLLERLLLHEADSIGSYSARATISLKIPDGDRNFKAQIKSVPDSAAWVSVVPALGIEVARILLTPDSMKIIDKLHDKYFIGDHAKAQEKFGLQPGLDLLQAALAGKPIGLDPNEKYRSDRENGQYVLTSREKKRFVRAAEDISLGDTLLNDRDMGERKLERTLRKAEEREAVVYRYWIDPETFRVSRMQIIDLAHDRSAEIQYTERAGADLHFLPTKVQIDLSEPGRKASGTMELSRITLDEPQPMSFTVPEKYEPMP
ncbi:MAG: DUF4292 domain-containing protein, partial [Bacteroidota bacterium]|nr:DUF4292 domain-containing protein [Bacteroidota bacterium]